MKSKDVSHEYRVMLNSYDNGFFKRDASRLKEALWLVVQALFINSWLPGSAHRRFLLRLFGAKIGKQVIFKSFVRIKFPWKLVVGDYTWIGESCWIDNLERVVIGSHCCLSQGVYLCTGNHDRSSENFTLSVKPIELEDYCWLSAFSKVCPGVTVGKGAMLCFGSVANKSLQPWKIYSGIPCQYIDDRIIRNSSEE